MLIPVLFAQTGRSKGVVTTHKNFNYLSALWSAHVNGYKVDPRKDKYVSVLPFYRESEENGRSNGETSELMNLEI